ncbi:DUF2750 domain-containing protein [uncultured Shewanella sp.]|uniref:DUF2750 domain-containing protein n=1 Tax=uncultured Shewanella sp. TaxID=173975 RepID=UPI002615ED6B|nr:DUF2750 domain-containing protein [uncultured Shewanella sp.]
MTNMDPILDTFINNVKEQQRVWGLQDKAGEGWVVCDSAEFENTDVMPLWSNETQAKSHCTEEWAEYQAVSISLESLLEEWISDLNDDGVLIGVNWIENQPCLEVDPIELATALVKIEAE